MNIYILLFLEFFKTGLFSIGGGLATLPFLYNMADKYPWFDRAMLADMIAVSESTPGPIGINMATYVGYETGGIIGGILATVALVLPSVVIIIVIAKFLNKFNENKMVKSAFYGLRPAVTALIATAGFEVLKISIFTFEKFAQSHSIVDILNIKSTILFATLFFITNKFKSHPLVIIGGAAIVGIIFKF